MRRNTAAETHQAIPFPNVSGYLVYYTYYVKSKGESPMHHNVSLGDNDNPQVPDGCGLIVAQCAVAGAALVYLALALTHNDRAKCHICGERTGQAVVAGLLVCGRCFEAAQHETIRLWRASLKLVLGGWPR